MIIILKALWLYRGLIYGLVARDFKSRYLNSILGSLWAVLNPLAMIFVYTIIFSRVMQAKLPGVEDHLGYSIYLCSGLLPWLLFSETISRHINIFIEQSNILKKVNFPRSSLSFYILISSGINFAIIYIIFIIFLVVEGKFPGWTILGIFPLLILQQGFALAIGILFGTLNVFFRDVGHVIGIVLQFWFWLTPIVYPLAAVPEDFIGLFSLNLMVPVIKGYQLIFLNNQWPEWASLIPTIIITVLLLVVSYLTFKKLEKEMVDEL